MTNEIGNAIRRVRLERGMSQQALAQAAGGRNVTQINAYERGRSRPSERVLNEIADALGVSLLELLGPGMTVINQSAEVDLIQTLKAKVATALGVHPVAVQLKIELIV